MPPVVPLLEIRDLVKTYGAHVVLAGVNLVVDRGETVVILGGSGSGKTTLARVVVGLEASTAGQILLEGRDLTTLHGRALERERHRFAMVFQHYALLDSLSVYDNVAFPLREQRRMTEAEIEERVMVQLDALGVAGAAKLLPGELSGGMSKRVGIARAMVMAPEILVYDEPTSGLDPVTSRVVDELIEAVRERYCVTSLVITHDMASAYGIADRVVLLAGGRVALDGPAAQILALDDPRISSFATASGIDAHRLARHPNRQAPVEIAARWKARRLQ